MILWLPSGHRHMDFLRVCPGHHVPKWIVCLCCPSLMLFTAPLNGISSHLAFFHGNFLAFGPHYRCQKSPHVSPPEQLPPSPSSRSPTPPGLQVPLLPLLPPANPLLIPQWCFQSMWVRLSPSLNKTIQRFLIRPTDHSSWSSSIVSSPTSLLNLLPATVVLSPLWERACFFTSVLFTWCCSSSCSSV